MLVSLSVSVAVGEACNIQSQSSLPWSRLRSGIPAAYAEETVADLVRPCLGDGASEDGVVERDEVREEERLEKRDLIR